MMFPEGNACEDLIKYHFNTLRYYPPLQEMDA